MTSKVHDQVLALAGVMQAAVLVDTLAREGQIAPEELKTLVRGVANTSPASVMEVYGSIPELRLGLNGLRSLLSREGQGVNAEVVRYCMSLLHIESKVRKNSALMDKLAAGIERTKGQIEYFNSESHESVVGSLAQCYVDTISTLSFRIQVTGNPTLLQDDRIASSIRAALLFGVRSAILWRQMGGRRWHFLVKRQKLLAIAREIQTRGLH
jgi:high frequency lysogenization protein